MSFKKIFITGGTGCIGHYVIEECLRSFPKTELHILCRDKNRLRADLQDNPSVFCHTGSMETIDTLSDILSQVDGLIHIATPWGNEEKTVTINVTQAMSLLTLLNPEHIQKIIFFSSASILTSGNQLSPAANEKGTPYIRSKYLIYKETQDHPLKDKIITLFPTLVFGGDETHPYSHIAEGLQHASSYISYLRFLNFTLKFHFCHGKDIAAVTCGLLESTHNSGDFVIGSSVMTAKKTIQILANLLGKSIIFQLFIPTWSIFLITQLLRIKLHPWDIHCIKHPVFEYTTVTPETVQRAYHFPDFESVAKPYVR